MMGWPVVLVDSGGLAVTQSQNGFGTPVTVAGNGLGVAVTIVDSGGLPIVLANLFRSDSTVMTADTTALTADYSK